MTPEEIERHHDAAVLLFHCAQTQHQRRVAWNNIKKLKAMRSAETIERLEKERGIYTEAK